MGVPRTEAGALAGQSHHRHKTFRDTHCTGTSNPLVGQEQEKCGVPPIPSHQPSAAVIDITENMRGKIYILCCKMGEPRHSPHTPVLLAYYYLSLSHRVPVHGRGHFSRG